MHAPDGPPCPESADFPQRAAESAPFLISFSLKDVKSTLPYFKKGFRELNWRHSVNGLSWTQPSLIRLKTPGFKSWIHTAASLTFRNKVSRKQRCSYANCCLSLIFLLSNVVLSGGLAAMRMEHAAWHWLPSCFLAWPLLGADPPPVNKATLCLYLHA